MVRPQAHALTRPITSLRTDLLAIVQAGIRAVDPAGLIERALDARVETSVPARVVCLAVGKAAHGMAAAAARQLGDRVRAGLTVTLEPGSGPFPTAIGSHPVPTPASEAAGRAALALAQSVRPDETFIVLLSGGASASMAAPADGVTLAEKAETTGLLLRGGASIAELNTVRKHLSAIKGGRLAAAASGATFTFAISDVVGDDLSVIGSGPTVGDPSRFADALRVLDAYGGASRYPAPVVARLTAGARGALPETPKPADAVFGCGGAWVIGGRHDAMRGAAGEARSRGYHVRIVDEPVVGDARTAGRAHVAAALAAGGGRPACLISSGETTVQVRGRGRGGRNQELALAAMDLLAAQPQPAALASVGTDGIDGPTDAAGAVVDSTTADRARAAALSAARHLDDNDSYAFFHALGDLVLTGPTGTNVGDLQVLLLA